MAVQSFNPESELTLDEQIARLTRELNGESVNPYYQSGQQGTDAVKDYRASRAQTLGGGATAGAGVAFLGGAAATASGIGLIALAAVDAAKRYQAYKKQARGGNMTGPETRAVATSPFVENMPLYGTFVDPARPLYKLSKFVIGSTKADSQIKRDRVRIDLQKTGFLNKEDKSDYTFKFADGGVFDFGKDGGAKLKNFDGKGERGYKEIDFTNTNATTASEYNAGLAKIITSGVSDPNIANDYTGYLTNAALEGAKDSEAVRIRTKEMYEKAGLKDIETVNEAYDELVKNGRMTEAEATAMKAGSAKVGLSSRAKPAATGGGGWDYEPLPEKKMDRKRLNSRFDSGFSAAPKGNNTSTGVNQYLAMIEQMNGRRQ